MLNRFSGLKNMFVMIRGIFLYFKYLSSELKFRYFNYV